MKMHASKNQEKTIIFKLKPVQANFEQFEEDAFSLSGMPSDRSILEKSIGFVAKYANLFSSKFFPDEGLIFRSETVFETSDKAQEDQKNAAVFFAVFTENNLSPEISRKIEVACRQFFGKLISEEITQEDLFEGSDFFYLAEESLMSSQELKNFLTESLRAIEKKKLTSIVEISSRSLGAPRSFSKIHFKRRVVNSGDKKNRETHKGIFQIETLYFKDNLVVAEVVRENKLTSERLKFSIVPEVKESLRKILAASETFQGVYEEEPGESLSKKILHLTAVELAEDEEILSGGFR